MSNKNYDKCATCGDFRREHFDFTGLCNLGFCRSHCTEFVQGEPVEAPDRGYHYEYEGRWAKKVWH